MFDMLHLELFYYEWIYMCMNHDDKNAVKEDKIESIFAKTLNIRI